jgi:hypothetical protein
MAECFVIIRAEGAQVGWRRRNRTVNIIHAAGVKVVTGIKASWRMCGL